MSDSFSPLIMRLLFVLVFVILPSSAAKKAAQRKNASAQRENRPAEKPQTTGEKFPSAAFPARKEAAVQQPQGEGESLWEHDHTSYAGSLGSLSTEGFDPCHEEQLASSLPSAQEDEPREIPGLSLRWTGDEIVRGLVVSEVLKRKTSSR